ncbi:MAG: hypothetical protein JSU04_06410 [Bdellovibrionales bacterium]|nr:hypothetical protein [Bdellovibrionales bacterium]
MRITERSYSTKNFRPRPEIYVEPDGSFIVVTTSWGSPEHAARLNEDVAKYVQAAKADVEVTSPFEFLTSLTNQANYLRIATLIANESFYRSENKADYQAGLETLLLLRTGSQMAYAQVGSPHLLIQKSDKVMAPISVNFDSSLEMSGEDGALMPPLPQTLVGIDTSLNIRVGDFRIEDSDRLILYAGGIWPESIWNSSYSADLQQMTQKLVQKNPDAPFWLGIVELGD